MIVSTVPSYKWTRQKYDKMTANGMFHPKTHHELINGDIIDILPQSSLHSSIIIIVKKILESIISKDCYIRVQMPLALGQDSEPEPDIAIVKYNFDNCSVPCPEKTLLVIEISESSSILLDRKIKKKLYACSNIPEYWIINLKISCIEVYRNPLQDSYTDMKILHNSDNITPLFNPEISISIADILP